MANKAYSSLSREYGTREILHWSQIQTISDCHNAQDVSLTARKGRLNDLREAQRHNNPDATAPDNCLACANFVVGKFVGLFPVSFSKADPHFDDFLHSPEVFQSKMMVNELIHALGWIPALKDANKRAIPLAVKWGRQRRDADNIELVYFYDNCARAEDLLADNVPLVVAVTAPWTRHFVALIPYCNERWIVDSWGKETSRSVVKLTPSFSCCRPIQVDINAGPGTWIPSTPAFFGYYQEKVSKVPLKRTIPF